MVAYQDSPEPPSTALGHVGLSRARPLTRDTGQLHVHAFWGGKTSAVRTEQRQTGGWGEWGHMPKDSNRGIAQKVINCPVQIHRLSPPTPPTAPPITSHMNNE